MSSPELRADSPLDPERAAPGAEAPRAEPPPLPMIEANLVPDAEIWCLQRDCNWLQALEGDIDTSHFGYLHAGHLEPEDVPPGHPLEYTSDERAPGGPRGSTHAQAPAFLATT